MHQMVEAFATGVQICGDNATVTIGGKEQPLLLIDSAPDVKGVHIYTRAGQPWIGRETEISLLHEFRTDPRSFAWWTIVGAGGTGKSRLAFEFARAVNAENWRAGFFPPNVRSFAWERWDVLLPTLVVVDDASRQIDEIGGIIETLARGDSAGKLKFPVRLLLIDRHEAFLEALGSSELRRETYLRPTCFRAPLELRPLTESALRQLTSELVGGDSAEIPDLVMTAVERIDPGVRRPLYLRFIAEAVSRGQNPSDWDRAKLLRAHLKDLEIRRWPRTEQGVTEADLDEDKRVLTFATVTHALFFTDFSKAAAAGAPLPPQTTPSQIKRLAQMVDEPRLTGWLPPLKPDILGELFAIDFLAYRATFAPNVVKGMLDAGWSLYPTGMWAFFRGSFEDWGDDADPVALLRYLPPAGSRASWARTLSSEIQIRFEVPAHHKTAVSLLELLRSAYLEEPSLDLLIEIDESTSKAIEIFGKSDLDLALKVVDAALRLPLPDDTLQSEHQSLVRSIGLKSGLLDPYRRIFRSLSSLCRAFGYLDERTGSVLRVVKAALSIISQEHPAYAIGKECANEIEEFQATYNAINTAKHTITELDNLLVDAENLLVERQFTNFVSSITSLTRLLQDQKMNDDAVAALEASFEPLTKVVGIAKPERLQEAAWDKFRFEVMQLLKAAVSAGLGYEVRHLAASYLSMTQENFTASFFESMPADNVEFRNTFIAIASARPRAFSELPIQ